MVVGDYVLKHNLSAPCYAAAYGIVLYKRTVLSVSVTVLHPINATCGNSCSCVVMNIIQSLNFCAKKTDARTNKAQACQLVNNECTEGQNLFINLRSLKPRVIMKIYDVYKLIGPLCCRCCGME